MSLINLKSAPLHEPVRDLVLVEADHVGCTYSNGAALTVALQSATCRVLVNDRIALVGPSGSGKSTLLQLLGGFEPPTSGCIAWPLLGAREQLRPRHIGFIFQMPSLLPPLSVIENVELPLLLLGESTDLARQSAKIELERIGISHLADKLPEELSGGQAQRAAVARSMVGKPRLILADEPTGQLDHRTARDMLDAMFAALHGTGTALVIATHDPAVVERLEQEWTIRNGYLEVL
ncbi:ATP-binding cassette domain-containing protein [Paenibacillus alginolyticus]|uniref:ATP-binding cassette domain-containing protein n=1 Tax=Paenibacillus alginolyticus TaxID=59839 RepID=A0ABT4GN23_9BACL|nr:ATP-binding cassette domain-containing protein [Paenibacillus alginolyticus]MCY9667476.1 ATP-binding cassette domain-containing protein [Paenibacillus alginolyticus]MCY9697622.1 ATP-binding cassette domain-containing protein [Paenibacillus alginolyticus]MEC0144889.1 ATP-binding cassette domain-containing protein [Paenibacillus alginolyticus]